MNINQSSSSQSVNHIQQLPPPPSTPTPLSMKLGSPPTALPPPPNMLLRGIEKELKAMENGSREISPSTLNSCLSDITDPKVSTSDRKQLLTRYNKLQQQFADNKFEPVNTPTTQPKGPSTTGYRLSTDIKNQLEAMENGSQEISPSTLNSCLSDITDPKVSTSDRSQFLARYNNLQKQFAGNKYETVNPKPIQEKTRLTESAQNELQALEKELVEMDKLGRRQFDGNENFRAPVGHQDAKIAPEDKAKIQEFHNRVVDFGKKVGINQSNLATFTRDHPNVLNLLVSANTLKKDFIKNDSGTEGQDIQKQRRNAVNAAHLNPTQMLQPSKSTVTKQETTPVKSGNDVLVQTQKSVSNPSSKASKPILKAFCNMMSKLFAKKEKDLEIY